jgi:GPI-anchor transamidase subunit T
MLFFKTLVVLWLAVALVAREHNSEEFSETLRLRPLQDGRLSASFEFVTLLRPSISIKSESVSEGESKLSFKVQYLRLSDSWLAAQHYTLFPLAVGQLLRRYVVSELHLTLNSGIWNYESWGDPDYPAVGSGAEMWAWIAADGKERYVHNIDIS